MAKKKPARKRAEGSKEAEGPALDGKSPTPAGKAPAGEAPSQPDAAPVSESDAAPEAAEPATDAPEAPATSATSAEKVAAAAPVPIVRVGAPVPRRAAAWGEPFAKVARAFDWVEMRVLFGALIGLVALLVIWISLTGMSAPLESDSSEGGVFRAIVGSIVLGGLTRPLTKRLGWSEGKRAAATFAAMGLAILLAPMWRKVGVDYFGHLKTWLQEGSSLTMLGGLRGVGTRVTILLALVGGSLAAASGKHINIDVVLRYTPDRLKIPVFALGSTATAAVLLGASWGFYDYIAIESFNFRPAQLQIHEKGEKYEQTSVGDEVAHVQKAVGQHLFLFRKQVGLDLSALPHVLGGGKWDDPTRMNGKQWNELLEEGGFRERFTKEEVDGILAQAEDLEASRIPLVVVPGGGSARNLLIPTMNLMFVAGFFIIAIRFLLRLLLVISGHEQLEDDTPPPPIDLSPGALPSGDGPAARDGKGVA